MKHVHTLYRAAACLVFGAASLAQAAERPRTPADPADAATAVPDTRYRPAVPYRAAAQPPTSADQNWKALNRTVGAMNSMSLTMGGAETEPAPGTEAGHAGHRHDSAPQPAAQSTAASPTHGHHHREGMTR